MKAFLKAILWLAALAVGLLVYYSSELRIQDRLTICAIVAYAWWMLQKQIGEADRRIDARLERIEQQLHSMRDNGLSEFERAGLQAMTWELRNRDRQVDQP